jgi:hypothetical protein
VLEKLLKPKLAFEKRLNGVHALSPSKTKNKKAREHAKNHNLKNKRHLIDLYVAG